MLLQFGVTSVVEKLVYMLGFTKVEMSPRSLSFWAIFLSIRLVIFPVRTTMKGKQDLGSFQHP